MLLLKVRSAMSALLLSAIILTASCYAVPNPASGPTYVGAQPVAARRALGAWVGSSSPEAVEAYAKWAGHPMTQAH